MNKKVKFLINWFALALLFCAKASAQEWEYSIDYMENNHLWINDAVPLHDGNIVATCYSEYPASTLGSYQPELRLLSSDGRELASCNYSKPSYWARNPHVLTDGDGTLYLMLAYNPDHDSTCANYFRNFDNPPDHSIIGLYKLDSQLCIAENYEIQVPIDTFNSPHSPLFDGYNPYCGTVYILSAFVDDEEIMAVYSKNPSFDWDHPRGHDSLFFFRMGFDGTLLEHVGYDLDKGPYGIGGSMSWEMCFPGYQVVKTNDGFVFFCYLEGTFGWDGTKEGAGRNAYPNHAYFFDKNLQFVEQKNFHQRSGLSQNCWNYNAFIPSRHNTVYMSCDFLKSNGSPTGCSLYEYALDNGKPGQLPIVRYIERQSYPNQWDVSGRRKGVCVASDNSLYFAYALNDGMEWITIEHLSPDFGTISTLYYDLCFAEDEFHHVLTIGVTDDDDVLLTSTNVRPGTSCYTTITKFPAEAFVGIEEAHDNGFKLAIAYPNPGNDVLNICTGLQNARVEVYDMNGKLVHSQEVTEDVTAINAESWAKGVYVWKVYTNGPSTGSGTVAESGKWVKE